MDEKPDQIIGHIEAQRHELGRNLNELETRVRATTNWRTYFDKNPMMMIGVALGGGILMGSMVGGKGRGSSRSSYSSTSSSSKYSGSQASSAGIASSLSSSIPSEHRKKVTDTLEQVKGAIIAFGIAKAKEFMNEALPGFGHHLSQSEQQHGSAGSSSSGSQYSYGQTGHAGSQDFRTHTSHESYQPVGS
jgi:hypothetical protein